MMSVAFFVVASAVTQTNLCADQVCDPCSRCDPVDGFCKVSVKCGPCMRCNPGNGQCDLPRTCRRGRICSLETEMCVRPCSTNSDCGGCQQCMPDGQCRSQCTHCEACNTGSNTCEPAPQKDGCAPVEPKDCPVCDACSECDSTTGRCLPSVDCGSCNKCDVDTGKCVPKVHCDACTRCNEATASCEPVVFCDGCSKCNRHTGKCDSTLAVDTLCFTPQQRRGACPVNSAACVPLP